jgi:hypothetical protein
MTKAPDDYRLKPAGKAELNAMNDQGLGKFKEWRRPNVERKSNG